MARPKTQVSANQVRSIVAQYKKGGEGNGLVAIADRLKIGVPVVRRVLVDAGVTIRGKGRPVITS